MLRYILLFADQHNPSDRRHDVEVNRYLQTPSLGWRCCVRVPGSYAVYVNSPPPQQTPILLHSDRGVILGSLFRSRHANQDSIAQPLECLSLEQSKTVIQSEGRSLIAGFWGYYVAALHYPERSLGIVLRSPASPLPCFHAHLGTFHIFFSYPEDLVALNLLPLSVNWDSITAQMVGGDFLTNETGFNEIETLECGESMECNAGNRVKRVYWEPHDYLRQRSPMRFGDAVHAVRGVVDHSVAALSASHQNVLVTLSGGLDSSVVMSALTRSPHKPTVSAVTYYSTGCGDERHYARLMAQYTRSRLVESARNLDLDFHRFHDCNLTARPVLSFTAPDVEARNARLARDCGATAIFNGELGDNIFGRSPGPGVLVECLRHTGMRPQFISAALDYAMLTRQSLWRALRLTIRERRNSGRGRDFNTQEKLRERYGIEGANTLTLTTPAAEQHTADMGDRYLHPWLRHARTIAPGSDKLLYGLVTVTSPVYHSPFADPADAPLISPFLTQPVVESLLTIPGYLHCYRADDRAVARAAFSDSLPTDVVNRGTGKGGPDLWAKSVVEHNLDFLADFLLDGQLVKRGLLDRKKLEIVLSPKIVKTTAMVGDIFAKLYIEAWLSRVTKLTFRETQGGARL